MSVIYLDQLVYIGLLRAYKGKPPEYPKYAKICKEIIESSQKGNNKFPVSRTHLFESIKRPSLSSRKDLLKFIFDLSKFYTIISWDQVIYMEVRNAILKSFNVKSIDISDYVFIDESLHFFGGKVEITSDEPDEKIIEEIEKKLSSICKDSEWMANALCMDQMISIEQLIQLDKDLIDKLEKLRKIDYRHPDKNIRKKISNARFFSEFIQDEIVKVCSEFNLNSKEHIKSIFPNKDSLEVFLKSIPSAYVFHVLYDVLDRDRSRPIKSNDIYDIMFLAIAVPYCDVVVTERGWSKILNEANIGEMYNTRIIYKIEELSDFI